jgi:hypothetical protein
MRNLKLLCLVIAVICAVSFVSRADNSTNAPVKPYPLQTCLVCDMDLGMMGAKPYVFVYKGQKIKLCDESEKATAWTPFIKPPVMRQFPVVSVCCFASTQGSGGRRA